MTKVLISLPLGFVLGVVRELLVVKYQGSIIDLNATAGGITTWGIGHLDFLVFLVLARFDNPFMAYAYIYGESLASYFGIKHRRVQVLYSSKKRRKRKCTTTKKRAKK